MQNSIFNKLTILIKHHKEIADLLMKPEIIKDQDRYRELSKEYSSKEELVKKFELYVKVKEDIEKSEVMLGEEFDQEMKQLIVDEKQALLNKQDDVENEIKVLLLPNDPNDKRNVFLEIRAGTGGDEASIFAGDLFRMYSRYAEEQGWRVELLSSHETEKGGYKEIITRICGKDVYSHLKFESGVHRVQRVPLTEAQGRIHTSTCTVAVFPESDQIEAVSINPSDLRVDTFRSSGAGGQHVNVTSSAVRITHIPTGTVVECQDERSQHQNRARAMMVLQAKLLANEREKQWKEQDETRRNLVGSGARAERIRTYNFPQGRLTDHRINLTLYQLEQILEGNLSVVIEPLAREHQADMLSELI